MREKRTRECKTDAEYPPKTVYTVDPTDALAGKKLMVHSEDGNILLSFAGEWEFVPRIAVFNCADIPAQGVAERLINCWNNYQEEQQCGN